LRVYKQRNLIERCFNKLKQFRHIATRYDRNALNYPAMIKIAVFDSGSGFMSPQRNRPRYREDFSGN
jgi:transposase